KRVGDELSASVCCGLTEVQQDDDSRVLLARADSALYSAKAAGATRLFVHNGSHIREDVDSAPAAPGEKPSGEILTSVLDAAPLSLATEKPVLCEQSLRKHRD